jgi:hypothetical protein
MCSPEGGCSGERKDCDVESGCSEARKHAVAKDGLHEVKNDGQQPLLMKSSIISSTPQWMLGSPRPVPLVYVFFSHDKHPGPWMQRPLFLGNPKLSDGKYTKVLNFILTQNSAQSLLDHDFRIRVRFYRSCSMLFDLVVFFVLQMTEQTKRMLCSLRDERNRNVITRYWRCGCNCSLNPDALD